MRKLDVKIGDGDKFEKNEGEWELHIYIFTKEKVRGVGGWWEEGKREANKKKRLC